MIRSLLSYACRRFCTGLFFWLVACVLSVPSWEASATAVEVWYSPDDEPLKRVVQIHEHST
jgi:hypothetical protein